MCFLSFSFFFLLLEDDCFTVLYWPLPYSSMNQPRVHLCPAPPTPLVVREHRLEPPVSHRASPLAVYFPHGEADVSMLFSQFVLPPASSGLPPWLSLRCRRPRFDPWVGKIPWRRERLPTPVFWPREGLENSMDCVVRGFTKSRAQRSDFHFHSFLLPPLFPQVFLYVCISIAALQISSSVPSF